MKDSGVPLTSFLYQLSGLRRGLKLSVAPHKANLFRTSKTLSPKSSFFTFQTLKSVKPNTKRGQGIPLLSLLITKRSHVASEKHSGKYAQNEKKAPDPTPSSLWVGDDLWPPPLSFADAAEPPQTPPHSFSLLRLLFCPRKTVWLSCPLVCLGSLTWYRIALPKRFSVGDICEEYSVSVLW